jgi:hypothetical protein
MLFLKIQLQQNVRLISAAGLLLIFICQSIHSQSFTDSNLPIVVINTDGGVQIPDEPKVLGTMKIIYRGPGERNYLSDQTNPAYLNYNGRIGIEIRGQSSTASPKKQYGFTTLMANNISNNNVSLLDLPTENDWILNGMAFDSARIRDFLNYTLSRRLGNYASRTVYCEVVINNIYQGLYLLQEKIKADNNRVDIMKIGTADNYLPAVSGGYITKADKVSGTEPVAWVMYTWYGSYVQYIHEWPKPENATTWQTNYIRSQFERLESTARDDNSSLQNGYPSVIDVPSFIDYIIIAELGSNPDAGTYSTYFHKDRNGKLRAGPVWDCDLTYGNDLKMWGYDRSKPTGWRMQDAENDGSTFWQDLFYNSEFQCYFTKRWNEIIQPGQPLNYDNIKALIDQTTATISEAVTRDYIRWNISLSFQIEIENIKLFFVERMTWIGRQLGSYSACSNVDVPPLVMTRIMYNPQACDGYPDNEDLEFIEIKNNGSQAVDLTGIYFRGTGLVFQFPDGSLLEPQASLFLASDAAAFKAVYGFTPFGQYTRHLSNNSQQIVLADGFGNVIDIVQYDDEPPWPDADSTGYYLKLISADLDNNVAENWTAANESLINGIYFNEEMAPRLYPNPVSDILKIESDTEIESMSIFDIQGRLLSAVNVNSFSFEFDFSQFTAGTYIITLITTANSYNSIVLKE